MRLEHLTLDVGGGRTQKRHMVVHPGAVVGLPLLDDGRVVLIRNWRIAADQYMWELPAGTLEPDESDPDEAVRREVEEETGYRAGSVHKLLGFYPAPGVSTEYMHIYRCTDLVKTAQNLDDIERIEVHPMPMAEALAMMADGRIQDAKTIATLLWYERFGA